jgi:hypothetical protein
LAGSDESIARNPNRFVAPEICGFFVTTNQYVRNVLTMNQIFLSILRSISNIGKLPKFSKMGELKSLDSVSVLQLAATIDDAVIQVPELDQPQNGTD